jgi:hypothetical protein
MESSFEQFVSDFGRDRLSRDSQQHRTCHSQGLRAGLPPMASRAPTVQALGVEDELVRISQQGYSFSNHQPCQPEEEYFLDDFGQ